MKKNKLNKIALSIALLISACASQNQSISLDNSSNNPGIQLQNMDLSVRPQDDFFNYVNGNWVKNTKIPADKASWGAFNELRDVTDAHSLTLINDLLKQNPTNGSEGQIIKSTYKAYLDFQQRDQQGLQPLAADLKAIAATKDINELQNVMNNQAKKGLSNPYYDWSVYADMKNSNNNAVYLTGGFILLPRDYYQKKTAQNQEAIDEYQKFVAKTLERLEIPNSAAMSKRIVQLEQQMAENLLTNEQIRDANLQYNPKTIAELQKLSKQTNLVQYLNSVGVKTPRVIIDEIKYYKSLDRLFDNRNLDLLQAYYAYWLTVTNHDTLDRQLETDYFDFFKKYLQGQEEKRADDKMGLDFVNNNLGEAFGKIYVSKYFPASNKAQMLELIDYLKKSYTEHLKNLTWMSQETKDKALYKLSKLTVKVGYPDKWEDYSQLKIASDEKSIFQIKQAIQAWQYQKDLQKVGQKVDKSKWEMSPQTVNAYYNPVYHEIVFPAAILQPPFFNPQATAAINFGGIGGVIGHEITHGFDDSGAMFNADGNLENWWTKQDKIKFDKLTNQLVEQFNHYEIVPGYFINGKFTLGENIADLGGVNIAFDALKLYLKDKPEKDVVSPSHGKIKFTAEQQFFISWANVWRTKSTVKFLQNQVKVDPHSPGQIRAFAPLTNVKSFYDAFDVQSNDKLYRSPDDRVIIW